MSERSFGLRSRAKRFAKNFSEVLSGKKEYVFHPRVLPGVFAKVSNFYLKPAEAGFTLFYHP
jgi:hypothetical protein